MDDRKAIAKPEKTLRLYEVINMDHRSISGLADWCCSGGRIYWTDDYGRYVNANQQEREQILSILAEHRKKSIEKGDPDNANDIYWYDWDCLGEPQTWGYPMFRAMVDESEVGAIINGDPSARAPTPTELSSTTFSERTFLHTIAALEQLIAGEGGWAPHPEYKNRSDLVAHIADIYDGYISKRTLESLLPRAEARLKGK